MEKFNVLSAATMTYVTTVGVGGAIATYFSEIVNIQPLKIIFILLVYIFSVILFILWARVAIK